MTDRERAKPKGPPTTTARGGPRPATPSTTRFAITEMSGNQPAPSQTQRNYPEDKEHPSEQPFTGQTDEEDDEPKDHPEPGPSTTGKEREGPPGTTKTREGVYGLGLNR